MKPDDWLRELESIQFAIGRWEPKDGERYSKLIRDHMPDLIASYKEASTLREENEKLRRQFDERGWRIVHNAESAAMMAREQWNPIPLWALIARASAHGSTEAAALCRKHGRDPDEMIPGVDQSESIRLTEENERLAQRCGEQECRIETDGRELSELRSENERLRSVNEGLGEMNAKLAGEYLAKLGETVAAAYTEREALRRVARLGDRIAKRLRAMEENTAQETEAGEPLHEDHSPEEDLYASGDIQRFIAALASLPPGTLEEKP